MNKKNESQIKSDFPNHLSDLNDLISEFDNTWKLSCYKNGIKIYKTDQKNGNNPYNMKKKLTSYLAVIILITLIVIKIFPFGLSFALISVTCLSILVFSVIQTKKNVTKEFIVLTFYLIKIHIYCRVKYFWMRIHQ